MYTYVCTYICICICTFVHARSQCQDLYSLNDMPLTCSCAGCTPCTPLPCFAACLQAKFLPGTNNLHLVSAARDGLIIHHILSPSGQVAYTKKVAKHFDSAHKASASLIIHNTI